jgi:hypothetical protein
MTDTKITRRVSDFDVTLGEGGPTYTFRYLTVRQLRDFQGSVNGDGKPELPIDVAIRTLRYGLLSWRGVKSRDPTILEAFGSSPAPDGSEVELPFRPELLEHVLHVRNVDALGDIFAREQNPALGDLGNSRSPASSGQAESAATAPKPDAV